MKHGFIRVGAATPKIKVADCEYNTDRIIELIEESKEKELKVVIFPELCISAYTCGELFLQDALLNSAKEQLVRIIEYTKGSDMVVSVGLPYLKRNKLYNVAAVIQDGELLGMIPKKNLPNYSEFYEARHFNIGNEVPEYINFEGKEVPFGTNIIFECQTMKELVLGIEICEDAWVPIPPSTRHALKGATLIGNLSASDENTGKSAFRRELIRSQSARIIAGYIYADAGEGESSTDLVYSGHNMIAENGTLLKETKLFFDGLLYTEIDMQRIANERRRMTTYPMDEVTEYVSVPFTFSSIEHERNNGKVDYITPLSRWIDKAPFVPSNKQERDIRCQEITDIQAMGLVKRLSHTGAKNAIIGISGGLDSTLALLVITKAFDYLKIDRKNIIAVTMPCFGTTDRTYQNAVTLTNKLGATLKEIPINEAVLIHLRDIGHDVNVHDITYENAQARERTKVLMNIANQYNGLVIGTGDMSELALGWATYNGDHMSMYGVNCSVPKTLVRYLVAYFAETTKDEELQTVLYDVLDTPVSPELLPPTDGEISQKTEDIVGPYELHDFFLYYILRFGYMPSKVYRLATIAFEGEYSNEIIYKWLTCFYRRFFSQQFKRSCLPDGPKVGSVAVSPRGDLRMPSDASASIWMKDLEQIDITRRF
ncbi:NAD(+) synthase [Anaeromicropila herbilytica]|uniref:Glutamine-dependent NAD(+) synthetase n=1 Tax=Anaeromicropila herbilytica TaxID=2785025 RepID=A0A7R7ENJ1_9FIRM|nr:NAD(+) synthase [Anaeromicropila herbilytica]BCN32156.1 NAD(+) synthase [Anaeromicropila herbilytica]